MRFQVSSGNGKKLGADLLKRGDEKCKGVAHGLREDEFDLGVKLNDDSCCFRSKPEGVHQCR